MQKHQESAPRKIRIATYNVHGWVGTDNRQVPSRAIRIIRDLEADIVALQEATFSLDHGMHLDRSFFLRHTGMEVVLGPTFPKEPLHFGNILLSRFPISNVRHIDLSTHPHEPRAAIDAVVKVGMKSLRVVSAHLGLKRYERKFQADMIAEALAAGHSEPAVVMGDFNEWVPRCPALRRLHALFASMKSPKSFPSFFPVFSLDRILASPSESLKDIQAHRNKETILASDHLPVSGVISL